MVDLLNGDIEPGTLVVAGEQYFVSLEDGEHLACLKSGVTIHCSQLRESDARPLTEDVIIDMLFDKLKTNLLNSTFLWELLK